MNQEPDPSLPSAAPPPPAIWPPPPTNFVSSALESAPLAALDGFQTQNVWLVLFLTLITLGIYAIFWLRRQNKAISRARPEMKVVLVYGDIVLGFAFLCAALDGASVFSSQPGLQNMSDVLDRLYGILVLILSFQVRNGLNILLQAQKSDAVWFSGVYTWLLGVVYLQYKLNKNIQRRQTEAQMPPAG